MKNLIIIIGIIAATMFVGCSKKISGPLAQHPLGDNLPEVRTSPRSSSPKTSTFISPNRALQIVMRTWIYPDGEDSYVSVTARELNEAGEIINKEPLYDQKFSRTNLAGKEYRHHIKGNGMVYYSPEDDSIYFVQVFPKNAPLESYKIAYAMANLDLSPIKSINGLVAPVETIRERKLNVKQKPLLEKVVVEPQSTIKDKESPVKTLPARKEINKKVVVNPPSTIRDTTSRDELPSVITTSAHVYLHKNQFELPEKNLLIKVQTLLYTRLKDNHVRIIIAPLKKNSDAVKRVATYNQKFSLKNLDKFYKNNKSKENEGYSSYVCCNSWVSHSEGDKYVYFMCDLPEGTYEIKYDLDNLKPKSKLKQKSKGPRRLKKRSKRRLIKEYVHPEEERTELK